MAVFRDGEDQPSLVLDAGTGIRALPSLLGGVPFRGAILLTHLHGDHTDGLPFCPSVDRPDSEIDVWVPGGRGAQVPGLAEDRIAISLSPPHFPITPAELHGTWRFHDLLPGCVEVEGFAVSVLEVPHKGGTTFGFRIRDATRPSGPGGITYIPDHGPVVLGPGPDGFGPYHPAAVELSAGAGVLAHDAQHLAAEFPTRSHYGHSPVEYAVGLAREAAVDRLVLFHHDPNRTDDELDAALDDARSANPDLAIDAARQGDSIEC